MKYHLCWTAFINLGSENVTGHVLSLMLSGLHNCFCSILLQPGWICLNSPKENNLRVKAGPQRKWLWIHSDCGNTELSHRGAKVWHRRGVRRGSQSGAGQCVRTPKGLSYLRVRLTWLQKSFQKERGWDLHWKHCSGQVSKGQGRAAFRNIPQNP